MSCYCFELLLNIAIIVVAIFVLANFVLAIMTVNPIDLSVELESAKKDFITLYL